MIRAFFVEGLNGKTSVYESQMRSDLNLITGKNGSGKTTLLKLMWYMLSGNIEKIAPEVQFDKAYLETDDFVLILIAKSRDEKKVISELEWIYKPRHGSTRTDSERVDGDSFQSINLLIAHHGGSSFFFPTFRRIEGGFSMGADQSRRHHRGLMYYHDLNEVQSALDSLSNSLSVGSHKLVASISTNDIVTSLTSQYADISERLNEDHHRLSQELTELMERYRIQTSQSGVDALAAAQDTLKVIQSSVQEQSRHQDLLLRPFTALGELIRSVFTHRGIEVTARITLGDTRAAIASDKLSAGEKQMLSFLVYNAFSSNSVIFIDEPEISLHVDWQRQLMELLMSQGTKNQFIVATHSPFIYAPYADREIIVDKDRGDSMVQFPNYLGEKCLCLHLMQARSYLCFKKPTCLQCW
ncbi:MAG: ATP-binding protein [Verrucomicrobiaceae bacterium]|nr:MAG: ATP-binding protein [Verrucomicrobiaceae bacterium]